MKQRNLIARTAFMIGALCCLFGAFEAGTIYRTKPVRAAISPPRFGRVVCTTATNPYQLGTDTSSPISITIKADPTNAGYIYVWDNNTVSATNGFPLAASETCTRYGDSVSTFWVTGSADGQVADYLTAP